MAEERFLIVNADDLGLSDGVNTGVAAAHDGGIVTSASLMVRRPAAAAAVRLAGDRPDLAVGLHIDVGSWDHRSGRWTVAGEGEGRPGGDEATIEGEVRAQLEAFRELLGRDPTHLDSHHHTHLSEPVASLAEGLAAELGVPLRGRRVRYEGGFFGRSGDGRAYPEGIDVERLVRLIRALAPGWTELGCHPGVGVGGESSYAAEREVELRSLCDMRVRAAIEAEGVRLRSFADLA